MNKIKLFFVLIMFTLIACKDNNSNKIQKDISIAEVSKVSSCKDLFETEWREISSNGDVFFEVPNSKNIKLSKNKLYVELIEPNEYEIDYVEKNDKGYKIYIKNVDWHYSFTWIDKNKLISKWEYIHNNKIEEDNSYLTISTNSNFIISKKENKEIEIEDDINIEGNWVYSAESSYASLNIKSDKGLLVVMSNQIYIEIRITKDSKRQNYYDIFYVKPNDLGSGGIKMDWKNYSKTKKIAEIKIFNENEVEFKWLGFYNEKTKRNEFDECEFNLLSNTNPTQLEKQ